VIEREVTTGVRDPRRRLAIRLSTAFVAQSLFVAAIGCMPLPQAEVARELKQTSGRVAVAVSEVDKGKGWTIGADEPYAAGDSAAVFVLAEMLHQIELNKLTLADALPVGVPSHQQTGPGARLGVLSWLDSVKAMSVHDLAVLMLAYADPTAMNALIDRLTLEEINDTAQALGAKHTQMNRKIGFAAPPENYTTANDVVAVWGAMIRGETYSNTTRAALASVLRASRASGRVVKGGLAASDLRMSYDGDSPGRTALVHASGVLYLPGSRIAVAVLGENLKSLRAGEELVERIAKIIHSRHEEAARTASR
jgi:beta-lactamase class A